MTEEVLNFIKQHDGIQRITQTVIKESLNMPKATVSRHVKALKEQGLINIEKKGRETIINLSKEEIPIVQKEKVPKVPSNQETVPKVPKTVPSNQELVPSNQETVPSNQELVPSNHELVPSTLEPLKNEDEIDLPSPIISVKDDFEHPSKKFEHPSNLQEFKELLLNHKDKHDSAKYLFNRCFIGTKSSRSEFMKYFDLLNYAEKNV